MNAALVRLYVSFDEDQRSSPIPPFLHAAKWRHLDQAVTRDPIFGNCGRFWVDAILFFGCFIASCLSHAI